MSKPMTCDQAVKMLFAYLDRALPGDALEELERHLQACLDCCDRLQFSRRLDEFVRGRLGDAPLPDGIEARLRERIHAVQSSRGAS